MVATTHPKRWLSIAAVWLVVSTLVTAFGACSSTSTTTSFVTTGILVRAETLTSGRGCGRGPTNLFRYAVVVFGLGNGDAGDRASYTTPVTSGLYDCFADGTFLELAAVGGSTSFRLEVYAFNELSYQASRDLIDDAVAKTNIVTLRAASPTWTTQCTATQQTDVQAVALCDPLSPGLGGVGGEVPTTRITLGTASFRLPDGRVGICGADPGIGDAGTGEGGDAARDGSAEAAAEGGLDAASTGAPLYFTTARVRYRIGATLGTTQDVPCPRTYLVDVPPEPARYDLDVGLLDPSGRPLAQAACFVTTQVGATSAAVCP